MPNQNLPQETHAQDMRPQLALAAPDVAALLGVSERHVWKLNASGGIPTPVKLGRCVRWRRRELLAWLDAGCPSRDKWEQRRAAS